MLPGTWVAEGAGPPGSDFKSTLKIAPNGGYTCQIIRHGPSNAVRTTEMEGTFQVKDGVLNDTMTTHSNTNAPVPVGSRMRIVRMDNREMVLTYQDFYQTNTTVFRRVSP
jgi:hypothetical protein